MKKITKKQLKKYLEILKNILENFEKNKFYNISFININSFYSHLEIYNNQNISIKKIMKNIEKYIPLNTFNIELIRIYNCGLNSEFLDEIHYFKTIFYKKAILEFFDLILKANTKEKWDLILNSCENIRKTS